MIASCSHHCRRGGAGVGTPARVNRRHPHAPQPRLETGFRAGERLASMGAEQQVLGRSIEGRTLRGQLEVTLEGRALRGAPFLGHQVAVVGLRLAESWTSDTPREEVCSTSVVAEDTMPKGSERTGVGSGAVRRAGQGLAEAELGSGFGQLVRGG